MWANKSHVTEPTHVFFLIIDYVEDCIVRVLFPGPDSFVRSSSHELTIFN